MLTAIESARLYFLKPLNSLEPEVLKKFEENPDLIEQDVIPVGTPFIMNELSVFMTDDDVIAKVGVFPDTCILITDIPRERCNELVEMAKMAYDNKLKKAINES